MRSRTVRLVAAAALAMAGLWWAAPAVQGQDAPPEGWQVRTDRGGHGADAEGLSFVEMTPGFHVTTGPAGIFFHPDSTAQGTFRIESTTFLFDPGERNEGFGVFFGGRDLTGETQAYTYFLIRRDGSVLVKRRDGAETSTLTGWTKNDAVATWEERDEADSSVQNDLAIEAGADELVFFVNGTEVARMPRADQHVDGIVGVRVNHGLNLHVSSVRVTPGR